MTIKRLLFAMMFVVLGFAHSAYAQQPSFGKANTDGAFENAQIQISSGFPNPASQHVTFHYRLTSGVQDAKITFFTVLGSKISEVKLSAYDETITLPLESFKVGVYLYTISANGQNLATRKLVVKR